MKAHNFTELKGLIKTESLRDKSYVQQLDLENFIFEYLLRFNGYNVEDNEEASYYLLRATHSEVLDYVLNNIIPSIETGVANTEDVL